MTKEWVEEKNREYAQQFANYPQEIFSYWNSLGEETKSYLDHFSMRVVIKYMELCEKYGEEYDKFQYYYVGCGLADGFVWSDDKCVDNIEEKTNHRRTISKMCGGYYEFLRNPEPYTWLQDSEVMHFDGDIIITDPCYFSSKDDDDDDDGCFDEIRMIESNTIYGDWSCATINTDTKDQIGKFCADGGMVCVADLSDVLRVNPDFDYHINRKWTTTWIKDFCGDVQIVIKKEDGEYECYVEGHGKNNKTGEPINFITVQIGF